jgi:hypothetical protein
MNGSDIVRVFSMAAAFLFGGGVVADSATSSVRSREGASVARPTRIPLDTYRTRRSVTVQIGGQTGRFLLDTAGGLTIVTPAFAERIGCRPWGRIVGFHMMGTRIESPQCNDLRIDIAGLTLNAPVVGVLDVMSSLPKDAAPLDGLLSLDVFAGRVITLDVSNHLLVVETAASAGQRTRGAREAQARLGREVMGSALTVFVAAPTPSGPVWLELDSGNGGTILVSKPIAPLLGLDENNAESQEARFPIVGGAHVEGRVLVRDMVIDGNLGMPFLGKWRVTMDLARSRVWFAPTDGAAGP